MIDTHTHLTDAKFEHDLEQVIQRAHEAGVTTMICPATNISDATTVLKLASTHPQIYGLLGIYPGEATSESWEEELAWLGEMIRKNKKIVGVGEIGLDATPMTKNAALEYAVFEAQLKFALEHDYPVVIHTRNTEKEMWEVLRRYPELPRGQMHCFSGSKEWLAYVLDRGFYVGFDGNVTYKSAEDLRELAKAVPLERLLLETDAPYLPPESKRGQRNESANVRITAEFLAKLRGESLEELSAATSYNAQQLFGI